MFNLNNCFIRISIKLIILVGIFCLFTIEGTKGYYQNQLRTSANNFSTGYWVAPQLNDPPDNSVFAGDSNWISNPSWHWQYPYVVSNINYVFEVSHEDTTSLYGAFTTPIFVSGLLSNPNILIPSMNDGLYYWHVRAFIGGRWTRWSQVFRLTIDRSAPTVTMNVSVSWTSSVEEKIVNGDFGDGVNNWLTQGNTSVLGTDTIASAVGGPLVVNPQEGSQMTRIGKQNDTGSYVWENYLAQSFTGGAKSLAFNYNFFSRDYSLFDDPGFLVRLNDLPIFSLSSGVVNPTDEVDGQARSTGWQRFQYDLSDQIKPTLNLGIYAGNTGDKNNQSWVYIDKVTTYYVTAPTHATYALSGVDTGTGIDHYEYNLDGKGWQSGENFHIYSGSAHQIQYRAFDKAGNSSPIHLVKVYVDDQAPAISEDLLVTDRTVNSMTLSWMAVGNNGLNGRAAKYDLRMQKNCFDPATFVYESAQTISGLPVPKESGQVENFEVRGLDSDTAYCFGLKTADEAPNWSDLSNVVTDTTLSGAVVNPGDVIINELMWMGSGAGSSDEWLELYNTTDHSIYLGDLSFTKLSSSLEVPMDIDMVGKTIDAHKYFVIARSTSTNLKNTPDLVDTSLVLSNTQLQIKLKYGDTLIDQAGNGLVPFAGINEIGKYYSMERASLPGDGSDPLNWYTCIDPSTTIEFFTGTDERGTPGAENRSVNEPLLIPTIIRTSTDSASILAILASPSATLNQATNSAQTSVKLNIRSDQHAVGFILTGDGLSAFETADYTITYLSDQSEQGMKGFVNLNHQTEQSVNDLLLGTCSSGGTCVYNSGVKQINLEIILHGIIDRKLTDQLNF